MYRVRWAEKGSSGVLERSVVRFYRVASSFIRPLHNRARRHRDLGGLKAEILDGDGDSVLCGAEWSSVSPVFRNADIPDVVGPASERKVSHHRASVARIHGL